MITFKDLSRIWKERGFEIVLGLCIAFLLLGALYRKITGKKGTWSSSFVYPARQNHFNRQINKKPAKESSGEKECRKVLRKLFNRPFNNVRPDFLRNPVTGGNFNLELDCYDSKLRLAVEYNGAQHYKYIPYFHSNKEAFLNQKYRDDMKRRMCKDNGIVLIEVPHTVKTQDIESFLIRELRKQGYKV